MLVGKELLDREVVLESMKSIFYRGIYRGSFHGENGKGLILLSPAVIYGLKNKAKVKAVAVNESTLAYLYINPVMSGGLFANEKLTDGGVSSLREFDGTITVQTVKGELLTGKLFKLKLGKFVSLMDVSVKASYRCKSDAVVIPWSNIAHINTQPAKIEKLRRKIL